MSDSDDGAFASADEGDSPKNNQSPVSSLDKPNVKKEANVKKDSGESSGKSKTKANSSTSDSSKKETEKHQQKQSQTRQKKKGKGNVQQPPLKAKKEVSVPESSSKVSLDQSSDQFRSTKANEDKSSEREGQHSQDPVTTSSSHEETGETKSAAQETSVSKEENVNKVEEDSLDNIKKDDEKGVKESDTSTTEKSSASGGWGWGGWGSSLISAASTSVQTFTHQIGDGISTIMDTVESSLDELVPDEKDMSKNPSEADSAQAKGIEEEKPASDKISKESLKDSSQEEKKIGDVEPEGKTETPESIESKSTGGNWFPSWGIAGIAKKVTDTGKSLASKGQTLMTDGFDAVENLASGGIDVLESIGKKTYNTFSEHDPAFKKTREYLMSRGTKPNLSSVLREAKEQAENDAAQVEENEEARKVHFETQFDEFQGIAHLEALEMLSGQSEKKVLSLLNSLSSDDHKVIKPILISIKEVFEVVEEDTDDKKDQDFSCLVNKHLSELKLGTAPDKLNKVHDMVKQWMADFEMQDSYNPKAIHQQAIQSLAELTSKGVEQFHKAGELVLMQRDSEKDCKERAHSFARLTGVLCHEVGNLATKFTDCLNKTVTAEKEEESDVTTLVTNIYLEASNSTTYIQDAFQLLLPILQQAAIEHMILARQS